MKLLSRREGFADALKILRRQGFVGVLFDQNAGLQGALTTLFGRVCSTTELPGLMAEKFDARVYGIFPRRRAFWRVEVSVDLIATGGTALAAAQLLREAGAEVTDAFGEPLAYNKHDPRDFGVLVCSPAIHAAAVERLAERAKALR